MKRQHLKATSVEAALQLFAAAQAGPMRLPDDLKVSPGAEPYATAILKSRSSLHWQQNEHLLPLVSQLATTMHLLQREGAALAREGLYLRDKDGKKTIKNPAAFIVAGLFNVQGKLCRALAITLPLAAAPKAKANRVNLRDDDAWMQDPC